jgi:hypothetical protein
MQESCHDIHVDIATNYIKLKSSTLPSASLVLHFPRTFKSTTHISPPKRDPVVVYVTVDEREDCA